MTRDIYIINNDMENSNIIQFPNTKIANSLNVGSNGTSMPMSLIHHAAIDDMLETILPIISNRLHAAGFVFGKEGTLKEGALFVEAFRSMLDAQYHIAHPFQKLADEVFVIDTDGSIRLNNSVNIKFYNE